MTDLGHLLSSVEENVERAHRGAVPSADLLDRTSRGARRRRGLRQARQGAVAAVAAVAVAGATLWGTHQRDQVQPALVPTPGPSVTATDAPTPVGVPLTLGAPVQVAVPRDLPITDLLTAAGPGWSLANVHQARLDAPRDVMEDGDTRTTIALVSPTGERTTLLDGTGAFGVQDWQPGSTSALAGGHVGGPGGPAVTGVLDLRTGVLTPVPFDWEHHPLGLTVTGESAWVVVDRPADLPADDGAPGGFSPVAPGTAVAVDPEVDASMFGDDPSAVPHRGGRLRLVAADGLARDLGDVTLPHRLHPLSPDRAWLALQAPDGGLLGVDLRTGEQHPVADSPRDPACRLAGWADEHAVLAACPDAGGAWRLEAVDVADDAGARPLATSDVPVRDAWPLGDGRIGLGRVVVPAPCDVTSDPAVLADGAIRSLTEDWSPYDHGTDLTFAGGAVWTSLNGCYAGGRADPQRDVRVGLATGEVTTLSWLEDRRDVEQVVEDGDWRVTSVDVVPGH